MAEVRLTAGNDIYRQDHADRGRWDQVYGLEGNDQITRYQGSALGGPGNDTIEGLSGEPWLYFEASYWDSPAGIEVNLAEGWANDGWGGRDTLVNVSNVHASNRDDRVTGNDFDNTFVPKNGRNTVDGAGGVDQINFEWINPGNGPGRTPTLADLVIDASVDGRRIVITPLASYPQDFHNTLLNIEWIQLPEHWGPGLAFSTADLVTPQTMPATASWPATPCAGTPRPPWAAPST